MNQEEEEVEEEEEEGEERRGDAGASILKTRTQPQDGWE